VVVLWLAGGAGAMVADRYAAQVNSRVITVGDVLGTMGPLRQRLMDSYSGAELEAKVEEAYTNTLNLLIERALMLEDFARQEQKLPEQVVDGRINEIIHERFNNSRSAFFEALTEEHLTIDDWRREAKDHIVVSILRRREVGDKVVVTPGAVRALYEKRLAKFQSPEQIRLFAIVLHQNATNATSTAQTVQQRLAGGAKFEDVARQFSQGAGAKDGGDWGWLQPGDVRKELQAALRNLPLGQVSPVVPVEGELYILKIAERKAATVKPLVAVYGELEDELRQTEAERIYKDWIKRLKQKYFVKIFAAT
jgi:parvulin-like peptidyl-prolyl isomerase